MKYVSLICLSISLTSCYKNKCYTCTIKTVSADKTVNTTKVYPEQYCGKKPKEVTQLEKDGTYITSQLSPVTGKQTEVSVTSTCVVAGK